MAPARKVFTESMIRKTMQGHFEIDPIAPHLHGLGAACECSWTTTSDHPDKAFEDHFIDSLHKLWHEMFRRPTTSSPSQPVTDPQRELVTA